MRKTVLITAAMLLTAFASGVFTARADDDDHQGGGGATAATVGPVSAMITAYNYSESGATVDGLLVGKNVLLTFSKPVCGGIETLGKVGDNVTYSGVALTYASGFQTVHVTSFSNGSIMYPPAKPPKPSAYALTAGKISQLNYGETGLVNGFVFTPTSGPAVFVNVGIPSATLAPLLTAGAAVSVTGTLESPSPCSTSGTISEVDASSLTIGTTAYPISAPEGGFFFPGRRD